MRTGTVKHLVAVVLVIAAGCATKVMHHLTPDATRPEPAPQLILVGGEVKEPGQFAWTNGMTVADAIQLAGGFTDFVFLRWLEVRHWDGSGEKYRLARDYRLTANAVLSPGDTVNIPRW